MKCGTGEMLVAWRVSSEGACQRQHMVYHDPMPTSLWVSGVNRMVPPLPPEVDKPRLDKLLHL